MVGRAEGHGHCGRIAAHAGVGKLVGAPTAGGVIGTNDITLSDGSRLRIPRVGYFSMDGTRLEGKGVEPDVLVVETPADDPLVASPDVAPGVAVGVGHGEKGRQEFLSRVLQQVGRGLGPQADAATFLTHVEQHAPAARARIAPAGAVRVDPDGLAQTDFLTMRILETRAEGSASPVTTAGCVRHRGRTGVSALTRFCAVSI